MHSRGPWPKNTIRPQLPDICSSYLGEKAFSSPLGVPVVLLMSKLKHLPLQPMLMSGRRANSSIVPVPGMPAAARHPSSKHGRQR